MKQLRFIELAILSERERAARRIPLHPRSTIIRGENDTGKSSLLKSLYWTLGAEPPISHDKWKAASVTCSLRFSVDNLEYRMIRSGSRFCLFDSADQLLGTYTSVTQGLGPELATMFGFHLRLRTQSGNAEVQATPAFLFLPFYIDQDSGWTGKLKSFGRLQQFQNPIRDVLYFHMGIRPPQYYEAKSRATAAEATAAPLRLERTALAGVREKLETELSVAEFNVDLDVFREEVEALLSKALALHDLEQKQRQQMTEAHALLTSIDDQIKITQQALSELRADQEFAAKLPGDSIQCPTCHAEYENGFAERFSIAVDEDRCVALLADLDEEKRTAQNRYNAAREATAEAQRRAAEVQSILLTKKETLALKDVVRSESRKETRNLMDAETSRIDTAIGRLDAEATAAKSEMATFEDKTRTARILGTYRAAMQDLLVSVDVRTLTESSYRRPEMAIKETGSDLSRALLAFYFATVKTIEKHSSCAMCPLVIDSPRQQDQDEANWARVRDTISTQRPQDSQLVLALADDGGTDFGGTIVELRDKYALLKRDAYQDVRDEITPLYELALRSEA